MTTIIKKSLVRKVKGYLEMQLNMFDKEEVKKSLNTKDKLALKLLRRQLSKDIKELDKLLE